MTVQTETSRVSYTGSGTTGPFTIPFYFLANADIRVVKQTISTGVETELALTTDFTLTGAGESAGGELTLVSSLSSSYKLVIFRDPEVLQETAYPRNDPFPSESHEEALDRLTMITQRHKNQMSRAIKLSDGDVSGASMELPAKIDRASTVLGFDASGAVKVYSPASGVTDPANITYLPPGTGAVETNQQEYNERVIYIEDYGADPTGAADSSPAVVAALDYMANELQLGQAGLVGGLVTTKTPGAKWKFSTTITYPGINYQTVIINGSVNAAGLANGSKLVHWNGASHCLFDVRGSITGPGTGSSNGDMMHLTGAANTLAFDEANTFRYGVYAPNNGNGANSTENKLFVRGVMRGMRKHVYFPSKSAAATDVYEGFAILGDGLLLNSVEECIRIETDCNVNYGVCHAGIDCGSGTHDYRNLSPTSGWTIFPKYSHDPSYVLLGARDTWIGGPVFGNVMTAVENSQPGHVIRQVNPYDTSKGKISAFVNAGDPQDGSSMRGQMIGNANYANPLGSANSVALFSGYASNAVVGDGWTAFTAAVGRRQDNAAAIIGPGTYYKRRSGGNNFDIEFRHGDSGVSGTLMSKLYHEADRLHIPTAYTPSSAADSYGDTGNITRDTSRLYQKAAGGWREIYTFPVGQANEVIEGSATGVTMSTTNTYQDITSISLTAGTWVIDGLVNFEINTATCQAAVMGISTNSGNSAAGLTNGNNKMGCREPTADTNSSATVVGYVVSPGSTTTYYLKALNTFSAGNPLASGRITARRIA